MRSRWRFAGSAPRSGRLWVVGALALAAVIVGTLLLRGIGGAPGLELLALGPEGLFEDTVRLPGEWADTSPRAPDAVARYPLILGVRNLGRRPVTPGRLAISVPRRYRLSAGDTRDLASRAEEGAPLVTYTLQPGFPAIEPERLPDLIPAHDTLWLEVVIPSYYCVAVADSIPDFVPAPAPPLDALAEVRLFYSFEGGDLAERRTGTLVVGLDTATLARASPPEIPDYPMVVNPDLAQPRLGTLRQLATRRAQCGGPDSPMELEGTIWETESGGRFIALAYGGVIRKHLYDLDGDGVIERESWAPEGDAFVATRQTRLPIPGFLATASPAGDSALAERPAGSGLPSGAPRGSRAPARADTAFSFDDLPEPQIQQPGALGRPIRRDTIPPDSGG